MHPVIYDVAVSLDGYIAGPGADISRFATEGAVVDDYLARLRTYAHAVMGRRTYEFGYAFGLKPGANPYPWMETAVLGTTLDLPGDAVETFRDARALEAHVAARRAQGDGPVYLCGGGRLAGHLARAGLIDRLRVKRAPAILGGGTPLFDGAAPHPLTLVDQRDYGGGLIYQDYAVG